MTSQQITQLAALRATPSAAVSGANGVVARSFPAGSVLYRWRRGAGKWQEFRTAANAGENFTIPSNFGSP